MSPDKKNEIEPQPAPLVLLRPEVAVLTETEENAAAEIRRQHPTLTQALAEYNGVYITAIGKLRAVMIELRKAVLNPREQRLVLQSAGFTDSRVSEIQRIVNDTNENFERYVDGQLSFRLALQQARAPLPSSPVKVHPKIVEFCNHVSNTFNGPFPKKRVAYETERLGCRIKYIFVPIKGAKVTSAPKAASAVKAKKTAAVVVDKKQ